MASETNAALSLTGLSKTFQGQRALIDVDLDIRAGEVHALLGQNGSGKSTLIKILAGYHQPDPGAGATVDGAPVELGSGADARRAGIRFIHQDLGLIPELNAVDNMALGETYAGRFWLSDRRERAAARQVLLDYEVDVDVTVPVHSLSAAERSMLAIVRAIHQRPDERGLLVLDEPTASLPDHEVRRLFALISQLRVRGGAILYVTHRLGEVFDISDRVSVLRDGRRVATVESSSLDHDGLVELIVGRPLESLYPEPPSPRSDVVLSVSSLAGDAVADVTFEVHAGEIVGVAGLVGAGYDQVLGLVFGARRRTHGTVVVGDAQLAPAAPHESIDAKVAFASADRARLNAIPSWTLRENITLPAIPSRGPLRWLGDRGERGAVKPWLDLFRVVPADSERAFSSLSGGNQQKVVLARWMRCEPKLLLLDEPTNGVDTGAKHGIYAALNRAAAEGTAIVLSSSDAEELCAVCDRVLVLRNGYVGAVLTGAELTVENLTGQAMLAGQPTTPDKARP